jgi:outer membrane protein
MNSKHRLGMTAALALVAILSTPVHAATLAEVFALARQHDPRFQAARYEFESASFAKDEARAALLPTFAVNASRTSTSQNIISAENAVFSRGSSTFPTTAYGVSLSQPLFRGEAWQRFRQAEAEVQQAAYTFAAAEQELMLRTASAYLGVLAARDALDFARRENQSIAKQLDLAKAKFDSGQATVVNLHDVTARFKVNESEVLAAQAELEERKHAVREIVGSTVDAFEVLGDEVKLPLPQPTDPQAWVQQSQAQNLLVRAREQAVAVAEREVMRQRAGWYPTVDLQATIDRRNTGGSLFGGGSNVQTRNIVLGVNWPLYEGGRVTAATQGAVRRLSSSREDLVRDRRQVERDTLAAHRNLLTGQARIAALDLSVKSFESALYLKQEAFKAGLINVLPALDAERDLYAARRDAAQTRYEFLLNTLKLKQAIGVLSEDDLQAISRLMQPTQR